MRTTLDLDEDLLGAARAIARDTRRSLGLVVSDLAGRGLAPAAREAETVQGFPVFPVFPVPPDARAITRERAEAALEED